MPDLAVTVTVPLPLPGRGSPPRLNRFPELRARVFNLLCSAEFEYVSIHDIHAYRARVLEWCRILAREGLSGLAYPREFGGEHDAARHVTVFETIAFHDHSLLVKFGVQFGLFAGAIFQLGTRRHHERWLRAAITLELPGCFAMTETAHGSNVRDIETTATYLQETGEFEIQTPHAGARKDYIGNAALHGRTAVVFAQLCTQGGSQGVHAFVVPLRDDSGRTLPGVQIEDCGWKEGLNGVDNGRITFDHVRIPRENLLNRFGDVAEDGTYSSPVASAGRRFFMMLGTLVSGRTAIATAALSASKSALTIAIRYTDTRRQFGPEDEQERPVLDYLGMQRALLPRLAETYALHFALQDLKQRLNQSDPATGHEIEVRAAGLKARASAHAVETIQACREACGGQGYLESNRLAILRADTDVFTTFEGANAVLLQLVARGLLTEYREEFGDLRLWDVVRLVTGRAATAITELNPIATRRTDPDHLRDPDFHLSALRWREARLLDGLARRLRRRIEDGDNAFDAFAACQDHAFALANAHVERIILECTREAIEQLDPETTDTLNQLSTLFALAMIEKNAAWYLEKNYLEGAKAAAIREQVNALCGELRPHAVGLVAAFEIPARLLGVPQACAADTL